MIISNELKTEGSRMLMQHPIAKRLADEVVIFSVFFRVVWIYISNFWRGDDMGCLFLQNREFAGI